MTEILSAPEAAKALGVGLTRVYTLLLSGRLPGKRVDGRWQIDAADVRRRLVEVEKYKRHA